MTSSDKDTAVSTMMDKPQPGHSAARSSTRSLETSYDFKGSEEDTSTTMDRPQPGDSTARSSSRSIEIVINFKGSEEDRSTTMDRPQPGHNTARSSSRSIDTDINFKESKEDRSTTMDRPQPGHNTARSSTRSIDTDINFKGSEEDRSTTMDRPQPGHRTHRSSSHSIDTDINFKGSKEDRSTTMERPQPGHNTARSSSRSIDTDINFKGSKEDRSTMMDRPQPGHNTARSSTRSLDSKKHNKWNKRRQHSRTMSVTSCSSAESSSHLIDENVEEEDSALSQSFSFEDPDLHHDPQHRSDERMKSFLLSDQRSPTPDSGIPSSSGLSDTSGPPTARFREWASPQNAGPADVACDQCTGNKLKAWKSCLTCVRSFCEMHGRNHYTDRLLDQHQLVEVTKDLNIHKQCTELKQIIRQMTEENRVLREEMKSLKQSSSTPSLPPYICKGKTPTAADVILDKDTAHRELVISRDGKQVRLGSKSKVEPGPQRFDRWQCVLGENSFSSGRHYWHVEVNKEFTIGVMKSSAKRNGRFAFAPYEGFWCIFHYWLSFSALDNHVVRLSIKAVPKVLGVCVDVDEKWVTFYNVDTKENIHTFNNMKLSPGEQIYPIFRTVEKSTDLRITTVL